ncbi:hypothetical protein ACFWBB_12920 [Streptomyces sp. NPDC060000]
MFGEPEPEPEPGPVTAFQVAPFTRAVATWGGVAEVWLGRWAARR